MEKEQKKLNVAVVVYRMEFRKGIWEHHFERKKLTVSKIEASGAPLSLSNKLFLQL